jgi:zinc/manganese transport system substrate-binding protein
VRRLDFENENRSYYEVLLARPVSLALVAVLTAAIVATGCGSEANSGASTVRVVAAENFWGDIVRQIGGRHVSVTSLITDPSADPHQYESDARNAADVADARLVVVNGLGYDDFVSKLLGATRHRGRVVLTVADVLHVRGDDANPHLWYDIPRIPAVARAIESELAAADPADKNVFAQNRAAFDASLAPLQRTIAEIKQKYPGAPVAYTERVPQYLLDAAGLTMETPPGFARAIEDGNEPSPSDAQTMYDLVGQHRIRVLLYNAQATSAVTEHVQDLARHAGIPVVGVTETQPTDAPSYQAWQENQLSDILQGLGG